MSAISTNYVSKKAFMTDVLFISMMSLAICVASQKLVFMTIFTVFVITARLVVWSRFRDDERGIAMKHEFLLFAFCTLFGAFNDWNSVSNHRIYDYAVPLDLPSYSLIPTWMLLYWGLILRSILSLFRYQAISLPAPSDELHLGVRTVRSPVLRVLFLLLMVFVTRQSIYRLFLNPMWSWLPFAMAIVLTVFVLRPDLKRIKLVAVFGLLGPIVEVLYIQAGSLHRYHLGWFFGVPVWIMLWWMLAAYVLDELTYRATSRLFTKPLSVSENVLSVST